jgi:hypothetical protein
MSCKDVNTGEQTMDSDANTMIELNRILCEMQAPELGLSSHQTARKRAPGSGQC